MIYPPMKKIVLLLTTLFGVFLFVNSVFAATIPPTITEAPINLTAPGNQGINSNTSINTLLGNTVTIIFIAAVIVVVFFLIFGGFEWILSGGDKEKIGHARGRIINALIGLAILALAFVIVRVVALILHVDFTSLKIPSLGDTPTP